MYMFTICLDVYINIFRDIKYIMTLNITAYLCLATAYTTM